MYLVLKIAPGDEDAIRCKVVALIKNDCIDDALLTIEGCSKKSLIDFSFFKVLLVDFLILCSIKVVIL